MTDTDTHGKLRALALTIIMLLSVLTVGVAISGTAAANHSVDEVDRPTTDITMGEDELTLTITAEEMNHSANNAFVKAIFYTGDGDPEGFGTGLDGPGANWSGGYTLDDRWYTEGPQTDLTWYEGTDDAHPSAGSSAIEHDLGDVGVEVNVTNNQIWEVSVPYDEIDVGPGDKVEYFVQMRYDDPDGDNKIIVGEEFEDEGFNPQYFSDNFASEEVPVPDTRISIDGQNYLTIQDAVNSSNDGDTIEVASGTYEEQVVINKDNVTIEGPNAGTVGDDDTRGSEAIIANSTGDSGQVIVTADDVTIDGFEIGGNDSQYGVVPYGDNLTVTNTVLSADGTGIALHNWQYSKFSDRGQTPPQDIEVIGNKFDGQNAGVGGIEANDNATTNVDFEDNVFDGTSEAVGVGNGSVTFAESENLAKVDGEHHTDGYTAYYEQISQAIEKVEEGGTVQVYSGTYNEDISVDKNISVRGPDATLDGRVDVTSDGVTIDGLTITDASRSSSDHKEVDGILVSIDSDTEEQVTIRDVTIEDIGDQGSPDALEGIHLFGNNPTDGVLIENTTVRNVSQPDSGASGIKVQADVSNVTIEDSSIEDVSGSWSYGVVTTPSNSADGVPAHVDVEDTSFENLTASEYDGVAVGVDESSEMVAFADETTVHNSSFVDVDVGVLNKDSGNVTDATHNFWGAPSGPSVNDGGDGVNVSENVSIEPFYTDEELETLSDDEAAQRVTNEDNNTGYLTIQAAIDDAESGDILSIEPGTYEEDLVIDAEDDALDDLVLEGPNADTAGTSDRSEEAVLDGTIRIGDPSLKNGADGVTINGLKLADEGDHRGIGVTESDGVTIENTIIENYTTGISLDWAGETPSEVTITDNLLIDNDAGVGSTDGVTGLTISDNTFDNNDEGIGLGTGVALVDEPENIVETLLNQNDYENIDVGNQYAIGDWRVDDPPVKHGADGADSPPVVTLEPDRSDAIGENAPVDIDLTADDENYESATFSVENDSGTVYSEDVSDELVDGEETITWDGTNDDGEPVDTAGYGSTDGYELVLNATDEVGNENGTTEIVAVDNNPPSVGDIDVDPDKAGSGDTVDVVVASSSSGGSPVENVSVTLVAEDVNYRTTVEVEDFEDSIESQRRATFDTANLSVDGDYDVMATVTDEANNEVTDTESTAVEVDTTPPSVSTVLDTKNGTHGYVNVTVDDDVSSVEDNDLSLTNESGDDVSLDESLTDVGDDTYSGTFEFEGSGQYDLEANATDNFGNVGNSTATANFSVFESDDQHTITGEDGTEIELNMTGDTGGIAALTSSDSPLAELGTNVGSTFLNGELNESLTDGLDNATIRIPVEGNEIESIENDDVNISRYNEEADEWNPQPTEVKDVGDEEYFITTVDEFSTYGPVNDDTTPPTIEDVSPDDSSEYDYEREEVEVTVEYDDNKAVDASNVSVHYDDENVTDDGNTSISPSEATFTATDLVGSGDHWVNVTVADTAGNTNTSNVSFTVTEDDTPPDVNLVEDEFAYDEDPLELEFEYADDQSDVDDVAVAFEFDGEDETAPAVVTSDGLDFDADNDGPGEYDYVLNVSDVEGNWQNETGTVEVAEQTTPDDDDDGSSGSSGGSSSPSPDADDPDPPENAPDEDDENVERQTTREITDEDPDAPGTTVEFDEDESSVNEITFDEEDDSSGGSVSVTEYSEIPEDLQDADGNEVVHAVDISVSEERRNSSADVTMTINEEQLGGQDPADAQVAHRTDDGTWDFLDTEVETTDDGEVTLQAQTDGFSPFVVAQQDTSTDTPTDSPTDGATPGDTATASPDESSPTQTATSTPTPDGLDTTVIGGIVVVLILLVAAILYLRYNR